MHSTVMKPTRNATKQIAYWFDRILFVLYSLTIFVNRVKKGEWTNSVVVSNGVVLLNQRYKTDEH